MALSLRVVAVKTGPTSRRRRIRMARPTSVSTPATVPRNTAVRWYVCSEMPTASVHDFGISSPPM
jgi:hypothetical protein